VAYALVQDVAASWQRYRQVTAALVEPVPAGLILHVAGPTDEGVRVIDVWESEQHWQRFRTERLQPALAALPGPFRLEPTIRALHPAEVVVGAAGDLDGGAQDR
jgi:quinol monooxygenase YgiN